jgi:tetratricopeptide (TPR) repeat protein
MLSRFSSSRRIGALISRADRARGGGRWSVAARFYRKSLDVFPANPPIWVQYGHALKESGRSAEAEAAYRIAIAYDPASADARLQLGHVLKIQGKLKEAEASYLLAAALDPVAPEPRRELGGVGWSERELNDLQQPGNGAGNSAADRALLRSQFERRCQDLSEAAEKGRRSDAAITKLRSRIANFQAELRVALREAVPLSAGMSADRE